MSLLNDKIKNAIESLNNDERKWNDFTIQQIVERVANMLTSEGLIVVEDGTPRGTGATLRSVPKNSGDEEVEETEGESEEETDEEEKTPRKKGGRR